MRYFGVTLLLVFIQCAAFAQHQEVSEKPNIWTSRNESNTLDSASLLYAFKRGTMSGHFRYFFMGTDNASGLTDYYANAIGGGIRFETASFHHFQFGVSGFYIFNIGSSDFSVADPATNLNNRYEIALFDIEDPENKTDIDRLEELFLKYHFKKSHLTVGRQLINTPFINLQDGRMRPTEVQGLWSVIDEIPQTRIEAGLINRISPRSTLKYYTIGGSIGIYPSGVNPDGTKSDYRDHLMSKGIVLLGITNTKIRNTKLQFWNQYVDNIFNTTLLQADYKKKVAEGDAAVTAGVQAILQFATGNGGNDEPGLAYIEKNARAQTFGIRAGWSNSHWEADINYNRITASGRYLMPREWGRDPFFTFLPRERNEGLGDVHALTARTKYVFAGNKARISLAAGYYDLPEVTDFALNKYGMPSYMQLNADVRYVFSGVLTGFEAQVLFVRKWNLEHPVPQQKYIFNKTNLSNYNIILNYHF